ncbi:GDYXXLXY domain-containing protein [Marinifilum sp. D737]|uniref:GDYXXLXY domain-containing protein n=1 Tax=Marinifilum sp. D737 TaxID=2969628 RepID=UPI002276E56F|nr:GDYXXLXY domain-containing protein [Marinifilum sp. D737]MCY1635645.1 GDYXXLXY domain-containing protein [Marinifilum sp. D737]
MMHKKIIFPIFIVIALIQLSIPVKSIYDQEQILSHGKEFKFQTAPVDPNDPFRGKYIALRFKENAIRVSSYEDWAKGQDVFVVITENKEGFASPLRALLKEPTNEKHYLTAKIQNVKTNKDQFNHIIDKEITIQYPFNRYYMEETKAKAAEDLYRKSTTDSKTSTYALVNLKNGKATLKDVMINDTSIKDAVNDFK